MTSTFAASSPLIAAPTSATAAPARRGWRWGPFCLLAILVLYIGLLSLGYAPAISQPDDNGYFAQGSLLATSGRTWFVPQSDAQYVGMHWLLTPNGNYISRYPPGLAVVVALVYALAGYPAATLVNPGLSILALIGTYALARRLNLAAGWAVACVIALASNPTFVQHALSGDSHMAVTCCVAWGLYLLLRWSREGQLWQALPAGIVLGCIPTIRYPDAVMSIGVGVLILSHGRRIRPIGRHVLASCAGAAVPIIPLLLRNQLLLGAFWRTGYSLTNEQTGFGWTYFRAHAFGYIQQMNAGGLGLLFALGVIGIAYLICTKAWRDVGVLFALIALPMLLLYMAYYWAPAQMTGATMRFLLPTFPAFVAAGFWALAEMTRSAPRAARVVVPIVLLTVQLLWATPQALEHTQRLHRTNGPLAMVSHALDEAAQRGDVIVAGPQVLQDLDFVRHWKLADISIVRGGVRGPGGGPPPGGVGGLPPMSDRGAPFDGAGPPMMNGPAREIDPDAPSPMQQQKRQAIAALYPGSMADREEKFAADVRRWAGEDHAIYLVGGESEVRRMLGDAARSSDIEIVKRVKLPTPPVDQRDGGPFGGGGAGGRPGPGGGRGFGGPGRGGGSPGGPGGGGPMRMGMGLGDLREVVIARWNRS